MEIGRRIYYEKDTGNVIINTADRKGNVVERTVEQDFEMYTELHGINPEVVDFIQLEYGEFAQDFAESNGLRVNIETGKLEFSYPDRNEPEVPQIFRKPLSEEIEVLKVAQAETNTTLLELMETILIGGM